MKGILITIFSVVFMTTISVSQQHAGDVKKVELKVKPITLKSQYGAKSEMRGNVVRAKFKSEQQKKKTRISFKAKDGEKVEMKKLNTDF